MSSSRNIRRIAYYSFILICIGLFSMPAAYSQLSVKGGYSLSTLDIGVDVRSADTKKPVYTEFLHSYHVGLSQAIPLKKNWSLQADVLAHRGGGFLEIETLLDRTKLVLWQVRVPVTVRYELFEGFHLQLGGFIGHYFSSRYHIGGTSTAIGENFALLEYGYVGGGSYALSDELTIELRFNYADRDVVRQDPETGLDETIDGVALRGFFERTTDLSIKYTLR